MTTSVKEEVKQPLSWGECKDVIARQSGYEDWGKVPMSAKETFMDMVCSLHEQELKKQNHELLEALKEAKEIMNFLRMYGMIHTVKGVSYPEGTHEEFMQRAHKFVYPENSISKSNI